MKGIATDFTAFYGLELFLLCALMSAGFYAVHTDIHFRTISNRLVATLWLVGVGGHGVGVWLGASTWMGTGLVLLLGLGVAFLLYIQGLWAAGDAKLFWAMAIALPPSLFSSTEILSLAFPLWALLVNALVINMVFTGVALVVLGRHPQREAWPPLSSRTVSLSILEMAGLAGWVVRIGPLLIGRSVLFVEVVAVSVLVRLVIRRLLPSGLTRFVLIPGVVAGAYVAYSWDTGVAYVAAAGAASALWLAYEAMPYVVGGGLVRHTTLDALQPGAVLVHGLCVRTGQQTEIACCGDPTEMPAGTSGICEPGRRLTSGQLARLRRLVSEGTTVSVPERVAVEYSMPFAPALLASAVVTVLLDGDLVGPLWGVVNRLAEFV